MSNWLWGVRRQVSLLIAEGHSDAPHYPIGMVWDEARLAVERINRFHATQAVLTQQAVASILSKEGAKEFNKAITGLNENGK